MQDLIKFTPYNNLQPHIQKSIRRQKVAAGQGWIVTAALE
jgi:hypothetical protein